MAVSKYQKRMRPLILFVQVSAALLLLVSGIFAVASPIRFLQDHQISLGRFTRPAGVILGVMCIISGSLLTGLLFSLPATKISRYASNAAIIISASVFVFLSLFGFLFSTDSMNSVLLIRDLTIRLLIIGVLLIIRRDIS